MVIMARPEDSRSHRPRRLEGIGSRVSEFAARKTNEDHNMRISVIGSDCVGLVSAACFAEIGHDVISVDNDNEKIAMLERGEVPIHERFLPELLTRHRGGRLRFSTSVSEAVESSDVVFITVGTPQS